MFDLVWDEAIPALSDSDDEGPTPSGEDVGSIIDSAFQIFKSQGSVPMEDNDTYEQVFGSLEKLEEIITTHTSLRIMDTKVVTHIIVKLKTLFTNLLSAESVDQPMMKFLNGWWLALKRAVIVMTGNKDQINEYDEQVI